MIRPHEAPYGSCQLCDPWNESGTYHAACMIANAVGQIGCLLDHERYCVVDGDPMAGLSTRESAMCVCALIDHYGTKAVVSGDYSRPSLEQVCEWAGVVLA